MLLLSPRESLKHIYRTDVVYFIWKNTAICDRKTHKINFEFVKD